MGVFFAVWSLRATRFYAVDDSLTSPVERATYAQLLKFTLWALPAAAFAYYFRKTSPLSYLAWSNFPNRRIWLRCLSATGVYLVLVAVFEIVISRKSFSLTSLSSLPVLVAFLQFGISPLLEETLFRGLVMKELMTLWPPLFAGVLTSVLFLGAHLPFWLSHGGVTPVLLTNSAGVLIFSALACWLQVNSRSIWPPTFAHMANNLLSAVLLGIP